MKSCILIVALATIFWIPSNCAKMLCSFGFQFPTLGGTYEISAAENTTVTIPFHLKSKNCETSLFEGITISLEKNGGVPFCYITHEKGKCEATPGVPECKCLNTGVYELQKVVDRSDNGQWVWSTFGSFEIRQDINFTISPPEPPHIQQLTIEGLVDNATVIHGASVIIRCIFDTGTPPAIIQILDNMGHTVAPCITSATGNPHTEIKTCTLPHVTCKDSGTYKCETEGPDTVTKSVQLTVKGPPEISGAKQHINDETTTLMFTLCSHTMDFTKCSLSPQSPVTTDTSSLLQTTDVSSYSSWETCSRLNWTLAGEPPQLNMSVEVQGILFGEGSKWEVTLENAFGEGRSEFIIHSPHEHTTQINFISLSSGNGNGATTGVDFTPTESQSLLSNTGFVTLISNASVVGVIVLLVIVIVVTRRGRRARCLHENMRLQERRPPLLPQRIPQPAQIPHNHQERLQATAASSLGCSTQRPHSESSESDIYDKAREDEDECAIGAACTSMLQNTDCAAQGNGATNVPANIDIATNLPDDYLHAI